MRLTAARGRLRDERGAVLTTFAIAIPTLILFAALALDVGNWYVHKRQLQNRADAAALAAAVAYGTLYPACATSSTLEDQITTVAKQFGGATGVSGAVNTSVNDPVRTTIVVNSPDYTGPGAVDGGPLNIGPCSPNTTGDEISSAGTAWTDVKATETNVASLFGGFGVPVPAITANARVALMQPSAVMGFRPFAVRDPKTTRCVRALMHLPGEPSPLQVPLSADPTGLVWRVTQGFTMPSGSNPVIPIDVEIGSDANCSNSVTYPDVATLTSYDRGQVPTIRRVDVTGSGACTDGYFVPRPTVSNQPAPTCSVTVTAYPEVAIVEPPPNQPRVTMRFNGVSETRPWNGVGGVTFDAVSVAPGAGRLDVDFTISNQGNDTPINNAAWVLAGDDNEVGPIGAVNLEVSGPNVESSVQRRLREDNAADLTAEIEVVLRPLESETFGAAATVIRGAVQDVNNGATSVDCGDGGQPSQRLSAAVQGGCDDSFAFGQTIVGVAGNQAGALAPDYNGLWAPAGECSPNRWSDYPGIPRGDPRLIYVLTTTMGAPVAPSGSPGEVPVGGAVGFYVTGWQQADASCTDGLGRDNERYPQATADATNVAASAIWGHFIKLVLPPSAGTPADLPCTWIGNVDPGRRDDVNACLASLVR